MTTAVQVQYRRGTASQVAAFTGAAGEMVVDTTNYRVVVQDGWTEGGWPTALANRTPVSDAAYSAKATDRIVAYTAITAARVVALPAAASFPVGEMLTVVDESGSCSGALTLTLSRAGSDTINGATGAVISVAYGFLAIESNGSNAWTIVKQSEASGTVAITGGTINGATIGQTTRAAAAVTALGVNESTPGTGIVNVSGSYQVAGSQISAANLSDGTTGTGAIVKADAPAFTGNPTGITALGVNESTPGTGIVNISGSYQVAGSQISSANLSDGTTGTGAIVKADAPAFTENPTGITALGVNESTPGTGIVNVSGSYQVGGSQISTANLSDGVSGTGAIAKVGSPALTGTPTAPTAPPGTNTTQLATTAFAAALAATLTPVKSIQTANASYATSNTSASLLMAGAQFSYTPSTSGLCLVFMVFNAKAQSGYSNYIFMFYGSGSPPAANAAQTGTSFGTLFAINQSTVSPFTDVGILSLTVGTTYWFDLGYYTSSSSGTAYVSNLEMFIVEI